MPEKNSSHTTSDAVTSKCNLTKLTAKSGWYFQSVAAFVWYCRPIALCHCSLVFSSVAVPERVWSKDWEVSSTSLVSLSTTLCPLVPTFTQCNECLEGCMGTHVMSSGDCQPWERYALSIGAGWSQWRPLDILRPHLSYSMMQLLIKN